GHEPLAAARGGVCCRGPAIRELGTAILDDDAKANSSQRKWHDANLLRDAWCFRSGLIGPVRLRQAR
ncbi:MAG: hypothetical protein HN849_12100, partial [Victivallales bacterium]|nr:hypothetical protein [Victivallales bacterium]